jgi:hypothetical protein
MSFSFFKVSRPKTPQEVVKSIKESLMALDTKTVVEVKALEKVNFFSYPFEIYHPFVLNSQIFLSGSSFFQLNFLS